MSPQRAQQLKQGSNLLWEAVKLFAIPIITAAIMYYGAFTKLETQVLQIKDAVKCLDDRVWTHITNSAIHQSGASGSWSQEKQDKQIRR
jgi:hypothetical protein